MSTAPVRFGVWAPVHGPRAAHHDPEEPYNASWEHNRDVVLQAEALGFDSTLIAQHTINTHQEDLDQLETWSSAAALAALTSRIEIIAAIKPYLFHPVVLAKMALQVAAHGDTWFINGQPLADVAALIADVAARPRAGAPLRFGLSAFVIARDTDAEAEEAHQRLLDLAKLDAPIKAIQRANTDPKVVMMQTMQKSPRVGSNGGTAAGLVGSYDTVAARIREFHTAGIELFMLQFQPLQAEMKRFAEEVIPRVKADKTLRKVSSR